MTKIYCAVEVCFFEAIKAASTDASRSAAQDAHDRHLDRCSEIACSELRAEREEALAELAAERQMNEVMSGFTRGDYEFYLEDYREREMSMTFGFEYRA